jgi:ketosteroid isomerase-like protein
MASPEQIVRDFLETLEAGDLEGLISRCAEDIVSRSAARRRAR